MNDDDSCGRLGGRPPTVARWPLLVKAVSVEPVAGSARKCRSWGTTGSAGGAQPPRSLTRGQARSAPAACPHAWRRAGQPFAGRSGLVAGRFRSPGQELPQLLHALDLLQ